MSAFTPIKKNQASVHNSKDIHSMNEDKPDEASTKPAETANPEHPEAK